MTLSHALRRPIARRFADERGNATVEFVLVFPVMIIILVSAFEIALANVQHVMLERGTDLAVRELRLAGGTPPAYEDLRDAICAAAFVIPDCRNALQIEMQPVNVTTWTTLDGSLDCIDREETIAPVINFRNGQQNEMMLIRACAVIDPIFPNMGLGAVMPKDDTGGYFLVAKSAFVNEPD